MLKWLPHTEAESCVESTHTAGPSISTGEMETFIQISTNHSLAFAVCLLGLTAVYVVITVTMLLGDTSNTDDVMIARVDTRETHDCHNSGSTENYGEVDRQC